MVQSVEVNKKQDIINTERCLAHGRDFFFLSAFVVLFCTYRIKEANSKSKSRRKREKKREKTKLPGKRSDEEPGESACLKMMTKPGVGVLKTHPGWAHLAGAEALAHGLPFLGTDSF